MDVIFLCDLVSQKTAELPKQESNWWPDLLNAIIGSLIGLGVTVWALYRTFRKDKEKDEQKRIQFQREKIKYFQVLVASTITALKLQVEAFKKMSDDINKNPLFLPLLGLHTFNDLERAVHKINQEDYYLSYIGQFGSSKEIIVNSA